VPARYRWQLPAPSHTPLVPQLVAPWSVQVPRGSVNPAGTDAQRPTEEGRAQLRQAPAQASAQQTESTQKLLAHSEAARQGWPLSLRPQLPAMQAIPAWQSASVKQLEAQTPPVQW
jgi:hypothetical protein